MTKTYYDEYGLIREAHERHEDHGTNQPWVNPGIGGGLEPQRAVRYFPPCKLQHSRWTRRYEYRTSIIQASRPARHILAATPHEHEGLGAGVKALQSKTFRSDDPRFGGQQT